MHIRHNWGEVPLRHTGIEPGSNEGYHTQGYHLADNLSKEGYDVCFLVIAKKTLSFL